MDVRRASEHDGAKATLETRSHAPPDDPRREHHGRHSRPARQAPSSPSHEAEDAPSTAGAALDLLLTEAGLGTRARFPPGRETLRLATRLARRPGRMVRRSSALTGELAKVVAGRSELKPPRGDRRSLDPARSGSRIHRRLLACGHHRRVATPIAELEYPASTDPALAVDAVLLNGNRTGTPHA